MCAEVGYGAMVVRGYWVVVKCRVRKAVKCRVERYWSGVKLDGFFGRLVVGVGGSRQPEPSLGCHQRVALAVQCADQQTPS